MRDRLRVHVQCSVFALASLLFFTDDAAGADREFHHWKALRDREVVRQERDFSCGLAALATLLTYYFDHPVSESQLLARLGMPDPEALADADATDMSPATLARLQALQEQGVSLATLATLAGEYDLRAQGVYVRPELLSRLSVPAIAYVEPAGEPHFTVIRGVDERGRVQVADPSWGNRLFSAPDFARVFTPGGAEAGRLLLLLPTADAAGGRRDWFGIDRVPPLMQPLMQPLVMGH